MNIDWELCSLRKKSDFPSRFIPIPMFEMVRKPGMGYQNTRGNKVSEFTLCNRDEFTARGRREVKL